MWFTCWEHVQWDAVYCKFSRLALLVNVGLSVRLVIRDGTETECPSLKVLILYK